MEIESTPGDVGDDIERDAELEDDQTPTTNDVVETVKGDSPCYTSKLPRRLVACKADETALNDLFYGVWVSV